MPAHGALPPPKLLAIETAVPMYYHTIEDVIPYVQNWVKGKDTEFCTKVEKIFRNAAVSGRHNVLALENVFEKRSFEESNNLYQKHIIGLAYTAFEQALKTAKITATDIDCIITTSCTGHMSPSLETFLINQFSMKPTVQRLPVTEMGCAGGTAGLTYVLNYLKAHPGHHVALICGELTSLTFQKNDFSWANIVSTAIFGDGLACAIFGPSLQPGMEILDAQMVHFSLTTDLLGFKLTNSGFKMILDEKLPGEIQRHLPEAIKTFLTPHKLAMPDIEHFIVHPGGKKILHNVEMMTKKHNKLLDASWDVLRDYGNLSSATVLFILKHLLKKRTLASNEKTLMMAFGPGVMANQILFNYRN